MSESTQTLQDYIDAIPEALKQLKYKGSKDIEWEISDDEQLSLQGGTGEVDRLGGIDIDEIFSEQTEEVKKLAKTWFEKKDSFVEEEFLEYIEKSWDDYDNYDDFLEDLSSRHEEAFWADWDYLYTVTFTNGTLGDIEVSNDGGYGLMPTPLAYEDFYSAQDLLSEAYQELIDTLNEIVSSK